MNKLRRINSKRTFGLVFSGCLDAAFGSNVHVKVSHHSLNVVGLSAPVSMGHLNLAQPHQNVFEQHFEPITSTKSLD
jgi:hypothetical protein